MRQSYKRNLVLNYFNLTIHNQVIHFLKFNFNYNLVFYFILHDCIQTRYLNRRYSNPRTLERKSILLLKAVAIVFGF
jgi:hypothetical protein